mmetsp:Transcript_24678/g.79666  ORF Transcript_24678/g.79666 Transcript_24678/m.79666 type:complete len:341 (+) Transcript_24678:2212-3234(+)
MKRAVIGAPPNQCEVATAAGGTRLTLSPTPACCCTQVNALYGFRAECERRCHAGVSVWRALNSVFEFMPVGALIEGSILAVHGGLGASLTSLSQLRELPRPARVNLHVRGVEPDADARLLSDVLWSDPTERDELEGIQPNARGRNVVKFGPDRVRNFCADNGLQLILRAHQCVQDGFEYFAEGRLITLFSAPDYGAQHENDGAMLVISRELHVFAKVLRSKGRHAARHCWLHDPDRPVSPLRSRNWVPSSGDGTADESAEAFEALDGEVVEEHVHEFAGVVQLAGADEAELGVDEELQLEEGEDWAGGSPPIPPAGVRSVLEMAMAARSSGADWTLQLPD